MSIQVLLPQYLIPVIPRGVIWEHYAVVLEQDCILAVLPAAEALAVYPQADRVELSGQALLPGLINMHTHSPMTLLRGIADDLPLQVWLNQHIWPVEARWIGPEFVRAGTELALVEMLRAGTTCFNENYFFPDVITAAARKAGMRIVAGLPIIDFSTAWADDVDSYFARGLETHQEWLNDPLVQTTFAPHAPYSVDDQTLARIRNLADELDVPVHMHVLETTWDVEHSENEYGLRPLARLQKLGLLSPRLLAVHMTQLGNADIDLLAATGVHVVHCPESNLKLASGLCPVHRLVQAGVNVCIGTDGAASNNDLDILAEARSAAMLAKGVAADPEAVNATEALEMLTINAARALNLSEEIGSLEAGKAADLCSIDLSGPQTQPVYNAISQIVYACPSSRVSNVWVAGQRLLENNQLTTLDQEAIVAEAKCWGTKIQQQQSNQAAAS